MADERTQKHRARYTRKGWFVRWCSYLTGSVDIRTGATTPYVRDGQEWPSVSEIWVGPFTSLPDALRSVRG